MNYYNKNMDSTQLVQIRKDFYLTIRKKVEAIIGGESKELLKYRKIYEKELNSLNFIPIDKKFLFARMKSAQVVLVGDFHAQKQSTRGFLRIVRKIKEPVVLGLECLCDDDQIYLDLFLKGTLSEKEFLNKVAWQKKWGFPWENYRPLFKWAQSHKIPVFGINSKNKNLSLIERDLYSAKKIIDITKKFKKEKLFVQYGDFHIASSHLPKQLKKLNSRLDVCTVYQSPELIYFKTMENQKELSTDIVKLSNNIWALNVLPPWVKWQDYLLYLESGSDKKIKQSEVDPTDSVSQSVELLSKIFGIDTDLTSLSVYTAYDDLFFDRIDKLPIKHKKRILESIQEGISFYIPELQIGYLSRMSVNHVTKLAAQYIYFKQNTYLKTLINPEKDFLKFIWLEAVTYFCTKVKNPKRKTDTLQDIRDALQKEQFDDRGKEALMLSLRQKLKELQFISNQKISNDVSKTQYSMKSYLVSAQILGGIIGEKFFYAYSKKIIHFPRNKNLLFKDLQIKNFYKVYYENLELVESWPIFFKSKFDKL